MSKDLETRLAVIETKQEFTEQTVLRLESQLKTLNNNLSEMNRLFTKYQGMGVAALVGLSGLWAAISFGLTMFFKR